MEYESRKVKWYWLLVFIMFCGAVAYLLFSGNPYLYSHLELRSALIVGEVSTRHTIPQKPTVLSKVSPPTSFARYNFERTAVDRAGTPRSRSYEEYESHPVTLGIDGFEPAYVTSDDSGFYLSGKSTWALAVGTDGAIRWKYRFDELEPDRSLFPIQLDETSAYIVDPAGEVVSLDKMTGQIHFVMDLHQEVVAPPFIWAKNLIVPVKGTSGLQLVHVHRSDGQTEATAPRLDVKPGFLVSYSPALEALIATADNKVLAIDPEDWSILWTQTLTDPVRGPAVVVDRQIFIATLGAKILKLDGAKKGKIDWEMDLEKPAASPPSYLPLMNKLAVLDVTGALQVIDAKTGKQVWRQGIENHNPLVETWSARLKGNNIEEFKMDWLHKGWTIWSPCSTARFCIYTPGKGQQIQTVKLSGSPLTLPISGDHSWTFLSQTKPGHYVVSRLLEENEIKRLRAAAAKATP
jgi:hypothetical protein